MAENNDHTGTLTKVHVTGTDENGKPIEQVERFGNVPSITCTPIETQALSTRNATKEGSYSPNR